MPETPDCYGTMFPGLDCMEHNRPCRGKAFTARVTSQGIGVQSRRLSVDEDEWNACQACPVYRSCYDLCMARLSLEDALARQ